MHSDFLLLTSSRLTVRLDLPGTGYRAARFDWTTQVRQVTLDGQGTFLTHEKEYEDDPIHQGWGLAGEFGIALIFLAPKRLLLFRRKPSAWAKKLSAVTLDHHFTTFLHT